MRVAVRLLIVSGAVVVMCLSALAVENPSPSPAADTKQGGFNFGGLLRMPKLFDFNDYKKRFGKKYSTIAENVVRKTYFAARALRAYVSGLNYKWRRSDYFLAVNEFSDQTPEEKEARMNKVLQEASARSRGANATHSGESRDHAIKLHEFKASEGEEVTGEADKTLTSTKHVSRRKRDVKSKKPRDLSLADLIEPDIEEQSRAAAEDRAKLAKRVVSNQPDSHSHGLTGGYAEFQVWEYRAKRLDNPGGQGARTSAIDDRDGMYVDHTSGGCMSIPRYQGHCGSCYAFTAMAYMEWLYCQIRGQLVQFSEQYMIDCGRGRFGGMLRGCNGATEGHTFQFIENFGLERLAYYPYEEKENQCPYDENETRLESMGFVRMRLGYIGEIHRSRWWELINYGPMFVGVACPEDFDEYSGGVHDGNNCAESPNHAMLLVGAGREDGQDYWLLRNSYGYGWGEGGYMKLKKSASERCFGEYGYVAGTPNGYEFVANPYITPIELRDSRKLKS